MSGQKLRQLGLSIIKDAIHSVDPFNLIREQIKRHGSMLQLPGKQHLDLDAFNRIFIIGAGKGTAPMARAMEDLLGDKLDGGAIIVKYDHTDQLKKVKQIEAGHPVPDQNTLNGTAQVLNVISNLNKEDCVIVLLTGGGSALLELLPDAISLDDLQHVSRLLLQCGATIHEINCVRKHISRIKGGQLARYIHPATCLTLVLSDVIGDNLSVIASGPTSPDSSTYSDAMDILMRYEIGPKLPQSVLLHLKSGKSGEIPETPKSTDPLFETVQNIVIGNNRLALRRAEQYAKKNKFNTLILTSVLEGEAKEIAKVIAAIVREIQDTGTPVPRPACLLLGGEPTVHITGQGKGGRNQELCLAMAIASISRPYLFVSCGSDGTDGPTDAAGAIVTESTLQRSISAGLVASDFLRENDSYHFFENLNDLIKTGPTGTNVMDLILVLVP
jgi:glycerate-2-kinase